MRQASIHSIETMGLVDGPGIRTIFFLQGCPLKCRYCHNPDTQHFMGENKMSVDEIVQMASRYRGYYEASGGGVTFSGGEPLMQGEFLVEALSRLKAEGYSTCIDTSGFGVQKYYPDILKNTDYILLDIKHYDEDKHMDLTGRSREGVKAFMKAIKAHFKGKIIIRHVMVPGWTDNEKSMDEILKVIEPIEKSIEKIEILPYHRNGIEKYSQLNLPYTFETVPAMDADDAKKLENYINKGLHDLKALKQVV